MYEQSLRMPPSKERDTLYSKMRNLITDEAPWIFGTHRTKYTLIHGWLHNFKWNDLQNDYFKYLRVDSKKRAEMKPKL
jgi:ABC-type transport system substrate-binding protein